MPEVRAAVFASGSGTNLQSLLNHQAEGAPWRIVLVVSDREAAGALERGAAAGVGTCVIRVSGRDAEEVEKETLLALREADVEVIFLAGYLRLIPRGVVGAFSDRILNIHPALLPSFGGKGMYGRRVHEAVLASGARISGPTVHLVNERYDEGSIVAQWPVPVREGDTPESLQARVLEAEHLLYPLAAHHLCRAVLAGRRPGPFSLPGRSFALLADAGGRATLGLADLAGHARDDFARDDGDLAWGDPGRESTHLHEPDATDP